MNKKEKLKLFQDIVNHLNKKFCNNKLEIKKIYIFGKKTRKWKYCGGYYSISKKWIGISDRQSLFFQILTIAHELSHAWQWQTMKTYYNKKKQKIGNENIGKKEKRKAWCKTIHDIKGKKICNKFRKEIEKIAKVSM